VCAGLKLAPPVKGDDLGSQCWCGLVAQPRPVLLLDVGPTSMNARFGEALAAECACRCACAGALQRLSSHVILGDPDLNRLEPIDDLAAADRHASRDVVRDGLGCADALLGGFRPGNLL